MFKVTTSLPKVLTTGPKVTYVATSQRSFALTNNCRDAATCYFDATPESPKPPTLTSCAALSAKALVQPGREVQDRFLFFPAKPKSLSQVATALPGHLLECRTQPSFTNCATAELENLALHRLAPLACQKDSFSKLQEGLLNKPAFQLCRVSPSSSRRSCFAGEMGKAGLQA